MKTHYVFIPLAMNQTVFYDKIARKLQSAGHDVSFICFHERSHYELMAKGFTSHNPYRQKPYPAWTSELTAELGEMSKKYSMPNAYHLLTHEQVAYGLKNQQEAIQKYVWTIRNLEVIFSQIKSTGAKVVVVQELGGFASVISAYYMARSFNYDHYFIEPSYFKGRYFLMKNSFGPVSIRELASEVRAEAVDRLLQAQESGQIVIPFKDRAHYLNLFDKVFNAHNFKRFVQKLTDKYVLGYYEEFRYISGFTKRHLMAFVNKRRLKKYYQDAVQSPTGRPFIYFPLHVPLDVAITFRSPVFKDQMALLDLLCRSCPLGYDVVFKEHPAMVGVINSGEAIKLLKKYNNLKLLAPTVNNYKVLSAAATVVTVNSKSGAEALSLGKQVIVLGDAFYTKSPLVHELRDLSRLHEKIEEVLQLSSVEKEKIKLYFSSVWEQSSEGDIYQLDDVTIGQFADRLLKLS